MTDVLDSIRAEADRIEDAVEQIERELLHAFGDPTGWRKALGYVEAAQRRVYQLRRTMLDEAIRANREGS